MGKYDIYDLQRFLSAQEKDYTVALSELKSGYKVSHWIWYVFPQVSGLGYSSMAQDFAIRSIEEAEAYLAHEILGQRLVESCEALLLHSYTDIEDIMGSPDDLKLRSSMTLFSSISNAPKIFQTILDVFYLSEVDDKTINFLKQ